MTLVYISIAIAALSLFFALGAVFFIRRQKVAIPKALEISRLILKGALTFLKKEYKILFIFVLLVSAILFIFFDFRIGLAFLSGAIFSVLAGNLGIRIAVSANARTAQASQRSLTAGFRTAFSSGSIVGLMTVGLGLLGISVLYFIFKNPQIIYGFGLGASVVALFGRVGGGIYTKAADIGADFVGKVEKEIPEDDPRNPAVIADNIGDNVGDVAGMEADLFESYVDAIIAAMVLGVGSLDIFGWQTIVFPLFIAGLGILSSVIGILIVRFSRSKKLSSALNQGVLGAAFFLAVGAFFASRYLTSDGFGIFGAILAGLVAGIFIGLITEYYTSCQYKPTRRVSEASQGGMATNIISGLALGLRSAVFPVLIVSATILIAYKAASLYGVALAAVGMLSTLGISLASSIFGSVADNAAGIAEMTDMEQETKERVEALDEVGNTTAAVGKGLAVGSAGLTALVLSASYIQLAGLKIINLNEPRVIVGLFLGALLPFIFCSFIFRAVSRTAFKIVHEVRRQFREIEGLMDGQSRPDYEKSIGLCTSGALSQMILPGFLAVAAPILIGAFLGKQSLAGFLIGAVAAGFLLALSLSNSGGAWDNAKRYIEKGNFGGQGSDAHKAAVVGDTIGDSFKDAAAPSINILIKLMAMIALIIAPLL